MKLSFDFLNAALPYLKVVRAYDPAEAISIGQLAGLPENILGNEIELSIDTRTLAQGQLFWALKGAAADGNDFVLAALKKGAIGAVIDEQGWQKLRDIISLDTGCFLLIVPDTLKALVDAATWWRNQFQIPIIGITGSLGKTTTKEMVRYIIEASGQSVLVTQASYNTLVGLSLTILNLREHHKAAVFEMGINDPGEMDQLVDLVQPTMALITCIAHSHTKGLGGIGGVAYEKKQIFKNFTATNIGIVFGDQPLLGDAHYIHPMVKFGLKTKNHIQARRLHAVIDAHGQTSTAFTLKIYDDAYSVTLNTPHTVLVNNALAAAAIGHFLDIPHEAIVRGLQAFMPFKNRYEQKMITGDRGVIMSDCYNASPESMRAAIKTFHSLESPLAKIAVLGDMLELGEKELFWHRQIGRTLVKAQSVKKLILVGQRARSIAQTAPKSMECEYVDTWQEAQQALERELAREQGLVLVKASKSIGLQNLVEQLT